MGEAATVQIADPGWEMAGLEYLDARLRLRYSQAALTGERIAEEYLLVVADTGHSVRRPVVEARLTALRNALRNAFAGGEPIVTIPPRRAVAIVATGQPGLSDSLARLRTELEVAVAEPRLPTTCCWSQPLPRGPVEVPLIVPERQG